MRTRIVRLAICAIVLLAFLAVAVLLRGQSLGTHTWLNPDEAELMVDGRAAMDSPVPFSTWMTSTIGPVWPLFLAAAGALGFPLTIAGAHLMSALIFGAFGFMVLLLLRRSFSLATSVALTLIWWLPLILAFPVGGPSDFSAMVTETIPGLLLLGAALFRTEHLASRPWLIMVAGALCGLAVGAKYQALPLAVGIVAAQLIALKLPARSLVKPALLWCAGAAAPFALLALTMLSPTFSFELLQQNIQFLRAYGSVDLPTRLIYAAQILFGPFTIGAMAVVGFLAYLSSPRIALTRAVLVASGLAAVLIGGQPYAHYLVFLYLAIAIAAALPVEPLPDHLSSSVKKAVAIGVAAVLAVGAVALGIGTHLVTPTTPTVLAASLSSASPLVNTALGQHCHAGSAAIVWGFAPDIYLDNDLSNAIPILNSVQVTTAPSNKESGEKIIRKALDDPRTRCVIDAVGDGFFPAVSLTEVYPEFAGLLEDDYSVVTDVYDCDECTVYVRN